MMTGDPTTTGSGSAVLATWIAIGLLVFFAGCFLLACVRQAQWKRRHFATPLRRALHDLGELVDADR